jgi:5-methylthioadenosine/S-adenosylhomocysteine deaminase
MILSAPIILTMVHGKPLLRDGAVVIQRGKILAVGPEDRIRRRYKDRRTVPLSNTVLLPGLVNVHTHLELPPLLNAVRAKAFPDWVMNLIMAKKSLIDDDYRAAAQRNVGTLVKTGTTTVGEICTHNVSPRVLKKSGLRAVVYHEIISMGPSTERGTAFRLPILHSALRLPKSARNRPSSLITHGLSPHAPYTVSKEALLAIKTFAQRNKISLAMHVAESKDEIMLLGRRPGGFDRLYRFAGWELDRAPRAHSPFGYLNSLGVLGRDFMAVHAVQASKDDIALLRRSRASVAHCPRSNRETGVGTMKLRKFIDAGIPVGLGTDSLASSPSLSLWDEMRAALMIHRKSRVTAEELLRIATIGGAGVLGIASATGTIAPGKRADLIAIPMPKKDTGDLYYDLLRETESSIMTMVNGKILHKV